MVILRESSSFITLCVWDAIENIHIQRQAPNLERITKFLTRNYNYTEDEVKQEIEKMCHDELLRPTLTVGNKGTKIGTEQMTYRAPVKDNLGSKGSHDWYCFKCHSPGDVFPCGECNHSYHESCIKGLSYSRNCNDNIICPLCTQTRVEFQQMKKTKLNKLLNFAFNRLKSKVVVLFKYYRCDDEEDWKMHYLIYNPLDISVLLNKLDNKQYASMAEFQRDIMQVAHNAILYQEDKSPITEIAQQLVDDCEYEILEMRQCRDCYLMSNEKKDEFWFAYPCRIPHLLVYAKQKGYSYWPAKVIKKFDGKTDVRFFGGSHERAVIEDNYVKPISVDIRSLCTKKTSSWEKAYQELKKHQEYLEKAMSDPEKYFSDDDLVEEDDTGISQCVKFYDINEIFESEIVKSDKKKLSNCKRGRPRSINLTEVEEPTQEFKQELKQEMPADEAANTPKLIGKVGSSEKGNGPGRPRKKFKKADENRDAEVSSTVSVPKPSFVEVGIQVSCEKEEKQSREKLAKEIESLQIKIAKLEKQHLEDIATVKKKQWCRVCEVEAVYHCCWNTAYCSVECQQRHWQEEHRALCKRRR